MTSLPVPPARVCLSFQAGTMQFVQRFSKTLQFSTENRRALHACVLSNMRLIAVLAIILRVIMPRGGATAYGSSFVCLFVCLAFRL